MTRWVPGILLAAVLAALVLGRSVRSGLDVPLTPVAIHDWVAGFGWRGPPVFLLLLVFRQFLALPAIVLLSVGGLCFGTLGGWPRFSPDNLGQTVALANATIAATGRRVDWIHLPLLDRDDDAFFAPLAGLAPRGPRVYLGAIHNMDGFKKRVAAARKFLPEFGVGAYCGLGRTPPSEVPRILAEHVQAMESAA